MAHGKPELILNQLERLEHKRASGRNHGQRRFKRFVARGEAELVPLSGSDAGDPIAVHLRDVGRGGVGFVAEQPVASGRFYSIRFIQNDYVVAERTILICFTQPLGGPLHLIGSQFVADSGLMSLLGVDSGDLHQADDGGADGESMAFIAPGEVA